jgi:hypothetical protein
MTATPSKLERQRLDGDWDGAGGFEDSAKIDEVEAAERDAIDGEDIVFEDVGHRSCEVVIERSAGRVLTHTANRPSSDRKGRLTRPA